MNIRIALIALSLTLGGYTQSIAQQNNTAATATVSKSSFTANINAYEQANGANSDAALKTLQSQMRTAISAAKDELSQAPNATVEAKMQSRINKYNTVVQKAKANDKSGAITALRAFADTL